MRFYRLTRSEAETAVRALVANFHDETPQDLYNEADFQDLAEQLSWILHGTVTTATLSEVYDGFDELAQIERGTHHRIRRNGAFTLDNTPDLLDRVDVRIREAIWFLLQAAGFTPRAADVPKALAA